MCKICSTSTLLLFLYSSLRIHNASVLLRQGLLVYFRWSPVKVVFTVYMCDSLIFFTFDQFNYRVKIRRCVCVWMAEMRGLSKVWVEYCTTCCIELPRLASQSEMRMPSTYFSAFVNAASLWLRAKHWFSRYVWSWLSDYEAVLTALFSTSHKCASCVTDICSIKSNYIYYCYNVACCCCCCCCCCYYCYLQPPPLLVLLLSIFGSGRRVPKSQSSCCCCCCCCCCCYQFSKILKVFLICSGAQQNFAYTFLLTFPTEWVWVSRFLTAHQHHLGYSVPERIIKSTEKSRVDNKNKIG